MYTQRSFIGKAVILEIFYPSVLQCCYNFLKPWSPLTDGGCTDMHYNFSITKLVCTRKNISPLSMVKFANFKISNGEIS